MVTLQMFRDNAIKDLSADFADLRGLKNKKYFTIKDTKEIKRKSFGNWRSPGFASLHPGLPLFKPFGLFRIIPAVAIHASLV